jgi:hypothetical protein
MMRDHIKIPKLPVPASWKLDRALAPSATQPQPSAPVLQGLDRPKLREH